MQAQQKMLIEHFRKCGGQVDAAAISRAASARRLVGANDEYLGELESEERGSDRSYAPITTRCRIPLWDRKNPHGRFIGANDNASGVAILMENGPRHGKS